MKFDKILKAVCDPATNIMNNRYRNLKMKQYPLRYYQKRNKEIKKEMNK